MDFTKLSRVCLNIDPIWKCCDKQHFMKYYKDSVKEYYVMNASDFVDLWRHHKNYVEQNLTLFVQKRHYFLKKTPPGEVSSGGICKIFGILRTFLATQQ